MASILSVIASPLLGPLFGILGSGISAFLAEWKADKESARKLAEMKAVAEIKADEAAWVAFTEAQKSVAPSEFSYKWVNAAQQLVRVFLTLGFLILVFYVYASATPEVRSQITDALLTCSFTAFSFWFGERYVFNRAKERSNLTAKR
jgi:hypothetical protein